MAVQVKGETVELVQIWLEVEFFQQGIRLAFHKIIECFHHGQVCFASCNCLMIMTESEMKQLSCGLDHPVVG